jgi:hypothetical protein
MPNEIRPCTLWGHTFDAIGASVLPSGRDMGVYTKDNRVIRFEFATREALEISYMEAITTIADALNAPVLATEEVLAGLPKDAKVWKVWDDRLELCFIRWFNKRWAYNVVDAHSTMTGGGCDVEFKEKELCSADRIKPDDPKTAEYLRQFTLEGVRIKEGG